MTRPRRTAALTLLTSLAVAAGAAQAGAAPAPSADRDRGRDAQVTLTPLGTYRSGTFDEGGAEIVAYDARTSRAFSVNAQAGTVDVLDISRPSRPTRVGSLATPGANSVAVSRGLVAVAQQATDKTEPGTLAFFDARTLRPLRTVGVGALPDMVTLSDDGRWAVVANEGEPEGYCAGQADPRGSISVVDLRRGVGRATVRTAGFEQYDGREDELRRTGVRVFGPGASASQDLEPEYVALSRDGRRAWVSLQENNALALLDVRAARVTKVVPLGTQDHAAPGRGLDPSDRDGGAKIGSWPVRGMFQPDGVAAYDSRGRTYLVTANEGDARDYECFAEEERVKDLDLSPTSFPGAAALQADAALGRLNVTSTSPRDADGNHTALHAFGSRSVSIRDESGRLVWDSGDGLERLTAAARPELFNADHTENDSTDSRSDNKGPEPEGVDVGRVDGRTLAFVGLERNSGIAVVDVTDPRAARLAGYAANRDDAGDPEAGTAGDLGPEGVHFVPASQSPDGRPLLLVGNEVSGTTTVWRVSSRG